jgi:amidase
VGMSAMPEFGLLTSGEALLTGPTLNPWNPAHTAGGSSTGAAVAVAAGLVPLAHASDAAGSIRVPAANCGVVGFKPGRGMNLRARAAHIVDDLLCSDALIGRSMRDVAWSAGYCRPDRQLVRPVPPRLRIAVDLDGLCGPPTADVAALVSSIARLCAKLGHTVDAVPMPLDRPALHRAIVTLWSYLAGDVVDAMAALHPGADLAELLEPWTLGLARDRATRQPEELAQVYRAIVHAETALAGFHEDWDVVLSPVTTSAPPLLGILAPTRGFDALQRDFFAYVGYTPIQNMTGTPSLSLPMLFDASQLPIGAMFSAAQGGDDLLLALGVELEAAAPWRDRWPPRG